MSSPVWNLLTVAAMLLCLVVQHLLEKAHERRLAIEREKWVASNDDLMKVIETNSALFAAVTRDQVRPSQRGQA